MRFDDERDPLDTWLSREVRPLPPPAGTFELITRRARRRKIRKLAVTVASAAAVAAAVAVAVPGVMALHLTPSPTNANPIAAGSRNTPSGGTESPLGSATPSATRPTPTASSSPSVPTAPHGPVPPNFEPSSVTFVNQNLGWVIGQAGIPGKCADKNPYFCTSIARTDDAGLTWKGGPAPKTGPVSPTQGVLGIRFLDGVNGWAFGPELWSTHDAGNHWHQVNTSGKLVTDLETVNHWAYALFADCKQTQVTQFNYECLSYTLMATPAGTDDWKPVGAATTGLNNGIYPAGARGTSAMIALTGAAGYLLAPDGGLYSGPIGGTWKRIITDGGACKPGATACGVCKPGPGDPSGLPMYGMLALMDATHLAEVCTGWLGLPTWVNTSSDGGAHWTQAPAPPAGVVNSVSYSVAGTIVMATDTDMEVLPAGSTTWQTVAGPPEGGFSYVGMTTAAQGVALPQDMGRHEIWMTFDGGLSWHQRTAVSPGS
jgi:hypothetical protein